MKKPALRDLKTIQPEHPVLCTRMNGGWGPQSSLRADWWRDKKKIENDFDNRYGYFPKGKFGRQRKQQNGYI